MELNLHVRHALPGETATHVYHARLGCIFTADYFAESAMRSDAVLPCLVSVPSKDARPALTDLTPNQIDLLLGALENLPSKMFSFQDREDREHLLRTLNDLGGDLVVPAEVSPERPFSIQLDGPALAAERGISARPLDDQGRAIINAYPEHEDGEHLTIESDLD